VILVDANILIYAHVSSFAQHSIARGWLDQQLNGSGPVGLPWASMLAFLRLVTNPRVFERPEPIGDAWQQVHAWLACETAWIPQPTERHAEFSRCPAYMAILYQMLIWRRWPWNTGLRCAPPMVILRGFAGCAGLIPSRPKHEECCHLIVVHNELPRCEDRRLIDAKFGLVMNVRCIARSFRAAASRQGPRRALSRRNLGFGPSMQHEPAPGATYARDLRRHGDESQLARVKR
jgi:hypothetical protein